MTMIFLIFWAAASPLAEPPGAEIPPQGFLTTPSDHLFAASRSHADCLVANAIRLGGGNRAGVTGIVRLARRRCRVEARFMDEMTRALQRSQGDEVRGTEPLQIELRNQEAMGRLEEYRTRRAAEVPPPPPCGPA